MECLPEPVRVFFSNDVDVNIAVDSLLDDFKNDSIMLLLFLSLSSYDGVSLRYIHYIPDLFFLKHDLCKLGLLKLILKAAEFLSFDLVGVILVSHFTDLNNLEENNNIILTLVHTPDLIIS